MARIRTSKPEWWSSAKWARVPRDVRSTYKGLWEVMCDDEGRFQSDPRLVKGEVWPFDDDLTVEWIRDVAIPTLSTVTVTTEDGRESAALVLYEVKGIGYGFLPGFLKHQRISHPTPSKHPPPPDAVRRGNTTDPSEATDADVEPVETAYPAVVEAIGPKLARMLALAIASGMATPDVKRRRRVVVAFFEEARELMEAKKAEDRVPPEGVRLAAKDYHAALAGGRESSPNIGRWRGFLKRAGETARQMEAPAAKGKGREPRDTAGARTYAAAKQAVAPGPLKVAAAQPKKGGRRKNA